MAESEEILDKYQEATLAMGQKNALAVKSLKSIFDLTGKVALVTGGTVGLGYAITSRLAEAGAQVVIIGRSELKGKRSEKEFRDRGFDVTYFKTDITSVENCNKSVEFAEKTYGKVDILVNNAARWTFSALVDQTEEDYDKVMDLNVKGSYFMAKAAARSMITHRSPGKIVNIASTACIGQDCNDLALLTTYNASKGAVSIMTLGMAKELRQYGIDVNCVAPGNMDTYGNEQEQDGMQVYADEYEDFVIVAMEGSQDSPMCNPDEVALVVFSLCTDVSTFTTGETIKVSGGSHLRHQKLPLALTLDIPEDYEPPRPVYTMANFPKSNS